MKSWPPARTARKRMRGYAHPLDQEALPQVVSAPVLPRVCRHGRSTILAQLEQIGQQVTAPAARRRARARARQHRRPAARRTASTTDGLIGTSGVSVFGVCLAEQRESTLLTLHERA